MEIKVENTDVCVKTLAITVSKEEVEKEYSDLFNEYKNDISIPGFRKGRFPRKLFERKYADTIKDDVKGRIKDQYLGKALEENELEPVVAPSIDEDKFERGAEFSFSARIELKPEFELPEIKKIKLIREDKAVTDEMIEQEIEFLRERRKDFQPKDDGGIVEEGDKLQVSYEILIEDEVVDTLENGSMFAEEQGSFVGETENYPKAVLGKKKGGHVTLKTTLPAYYHKKEYQGKKAQVKVTVKEIEGKVLPDIESKDFLDAYGLESVEDMRQKITESIENGFKQEQTSKLFEQIHDYIDSHMDFGLPPTLLEGEVQSRRRSLNHQLQNQKKDKDEIEKELEAKAEEFASAAQRALKSFFVLDKIADKNTIVVTEEEINSRIAGIAMQQRVTPADMKEHLGRTGGLDSLRGQIQEEKTLQYIVDHADVAVEGEKKKTAKKKTSGSSQKKKTVKKKGASQKTKAVKKKPTAKKTAKKKTDKE